MNITILNGNPGPDRAAFETYMRQLTAALQSDGHSMTELRLQDMQISSCTGCFACWLKTPGRCIIKDDSETVCRAAIQADLLIFASPVIMGFTSAVLKIAHDRLIPLIHPYIEFDQGECHHLRRYARYPLLGVILEQDEHTDDEDIAIISEIYRRDSINFKSRLCFTTLTSQPLEEVRHEINAL